MFESGSSLCFREILGVSASRPLGPSRMTCITSQARRGKRMRPLFSLTSIVGHATHWPHFVIGIVIRRIWQRIQCNRFWATQVKKYCWKKIQPKKFEVGRSYIGGCLSTFPNDTITFSSSGQERNKKPSGNSYDALFLMSSCNKIPSCLCMLGAGGTLLFGSSLLPPHSPHPMEARWEAKVE